MSEKHYTWMKAAGVRAIKTMCQTLVGTIGATALITDVDWPVALSAAIMAGVVSVLTSLAGIPEVNEGGQPIDKLIAPDPEENESEEK